MIDMDDDCVSCMKSGNGSAVTLHFINDSDEDTFVMKWIDGECNEIEYSSCPPGCTIMQPTYLTHGWSIYKNGEELMGAIVVTNENAANQEVEVRMKFSDGEFMVNDKTWADIQAMRDGDAEAAEERRQAINEPLVYDNSPSEKFTEAINFVNSIIEAGEPWTDPDFPPEQ